MTFVNPQRAAASFFLLMMLAFPCKPYAAEGGYSNYIPGTYGDFGMAVVPNEKWTVRNDVYSYSADISKAIVSGELKSEIKLDLLMDFTTVLYTPGFELFGAQYAAGIFNTYIIDNEIQAKVSLEDLHRREEDSASGLNDMTFIPFALYWHEGNIHWTASQFIVAPTGDYNVNNAMNTGLNYWTFDNNFALEYLNPKTGRDLAFNLGYIYNTENNKTNYHTGQELHLDVVLNQFISESFAVGLQGFYLKQITGDHGSGAQLGSFKGEAAGIGPALLWSRDFGRQNVTFIAKWLHEFHAKNRLEGDHVFLSFVLDW